MLEAGRVAGADMDKSAELIDLGLWNYPLMDPDTAVGGNVYLPIGPWATSKHY